MKQAKNKSEKITSDTTCFSQHVDYKPNKYLEVKY